MRWPARIPTAFAEHQGVLALVGAACPMPPSVHRAGTYKTRWYGSQLVVADRWFASSKTCHLCGHVQDIAWEVA